MIRAFLGIGGPLSAIARLGTALDRFFDPTTSTSLDPLLKDQYHSEAIMNSLQSKNHAIAWMETVEADVTQGRQHIIPKRIGRNYSFGAIPERGALMQAGRSAFTKSIIDVRWQYLRVGFDEWVMQRSRNDKGAFERAAAMEMKEAVRDAALMRNRIAWGSGKGILAKVTGSHVAQTVIELKDPGGVAGTFQPNRYIFGDANGGMFVHILDGTTPTTIKGMGTVVAVNSDGTDITLDTAVTCTTNDLVVPAQTATQNSYNVEPEGFLASVDDGTYVAVYHNITRSTTAVENCLAFTSVGPMSPDTIQTWVDTVDIVSGGEIDAFACEHGVARAFLALTELDRRYANTGGMMTPDPGSSRAKNASGTKTGLTYGNIGFLVDRDCPYGHMFGLEKESFIRLTWPNTGWDDKGGAVLKWVQGFDEVTAFWRLTENPHLLRPNHTFRASGITTSQILAHAV
jgi:hypothetical protein